jgi:hypothetical protein
MSFYLQGKWAPRKRGQFGGRFWARYGYGECTVIVPIATCIYVYNLPYTSVARASVYLSLQAKSGLRQNYNKVISTNQDKLFKHSR